MQNMQTFVMIIAGVLLVYFGLSFLFKRLKKTPPAPTRADTVKGAQTCPICSSLLANGERIKSVAFPAINRSRIMHIKGCPHCLNGGESRYCPVCAAGLNLDEILVARVSETNGLPRVRIFGCSHCGGKAAALC
jgi:hypothetical protein